MQQAKQAYRRRNISYMRHYWSRPCDTFDPLCVQCVAWRTFARTGRVDAETLAFDAEERADAAAQRAAVAAIPALLDALGMTARSEARVERAVQAYRDGRSAP
jgi:hypothetical protein